MNRLEVRRAISRRAVGMMACFTLLLSGCAAPRTAPSADGSPYWSGRLALTLDSDPPQQFSAGFDLRGNPETGELQLNSPLGNVLATVRWTPGGAEMVQGDTVTRRQNLDQLTTALGGTALPVVALFAWLRGQAADADGWSADLTRQPDGRIVAKRLQPLPAAELRIIVQP